MWIGIRQELKLEPPESDLFTGTGAELGVAGIFCSEPESQQRLVCFSGTGEGMPNRSRPLFTRLRIPGLNVTIPKNKCFH